MTGIFSIPAQADPGVTGVTVHELSRGGPWKRGRLVVIDLAPNAEYEHAGKRPTFIYMCEGSAANLKAGQYMAMGRGRHLLHNSGSVPCRILLMELFGKALIPDVHDVAATGIQDRPLGITLKSLVREVLSQPGVGGEYVELPPGYEVPRHIHTRSSAIVLVLSGSGYVGRMIDGVDVIEPVSTGDVVIFRKGLEHAFSTDTGMVIFSGQDPDIANDYRSVTRRKFAFPRS